MLVGLVGLASVFGCSKPAELPRSSTTGPAPSATGPRVAPAASASVPVTNAAASAAPAPCSPDAPPSLFAAAEFTRIHPGPVLSAAVGTPPRAAVWSGTAVTLFEGDSARELPTPRLPEGATAEVFFGRDNQPRLLGFAPAAPGREVPVYLRYRQGVFRPEPSELGPLAAPRGALYGVLGFADPEVVCRPRELCLVKRTTGWGRVAAHDAPARVLLRSGSIFSLHADHVERLGERGFSPLEPAWQFDHPIDVWLAPGGELWVTDRSASGLHRVQGASSEAVASPILEPRAVFGRSEGAIYIVGKNGAAEFDGTRFRCLRGVNGPLHLALAVGNDVWLAGESGVYRSAR